MISFLKQLLKQNRLTHTLIKRTRNFFLPYYQLPEMAEAWNIQYFGGGDLDLCFDLYRKNRDCQSRLAARAGRQGMLKKYLGPEWVSNIGTLANLDIHVKIGLLGWRPPQQSILTAYPGPIANPFFLGMWRKYFTILEDPGTLKRLFRDTLLFREHHLVSELRGKVDLFPRLATLVQMEWERQQRPALLQLDEETQQRALDYLAAFGMPRDGWFVALHVRENGHKHGEHDRCVRNADISTYLPAIKKITEQGGWVIRCGDPSMTPLPQMDRVLDYALSSQRHDWLDIFFAAKCRFMIGTQSGFSHVADTFSAPTLYTNWFCWGFPPSYATDVFLPKTLWSLDRQRALSAAEIMQEKLGCCENPEVFEARRIEVRNNTPEVLEAGVVQMLHETRGGTWNPGAEQNRLKQTFADVDVVLNARVGAAFLAKHEDLFR